MKLFASLSTALVLLTCMSAQLSHAQIFSWVDEHGVKHFGDQVPEKYKDAKHAVSLNKLNTTQGVNTEKLNRLSESIKASNDKRAQTKPEPEDTETEKSKPKTCKELIEEYEKSYTCFNQCRNANGSINRAKCPSCVSVTRPTCDERDDTL